MAPTVMGVYPPDSVLVSFAAGRPLTPQEVASSLPIDPLAPGSSDLLASDLEYRIHLIIQEARKFMYHSHRTTLLSEDIEYAMEALNVEVGSRSEIC
jgi:transcription initiation factor TFIID subunit 6